MKLSLAHSGAVALAVSSIAIASAPVPKDVTALEALLQANDEAWNAQDAAKLSQLYTSDGTARLGYSTKPVVGQGALREFFRVALASAPGTRHFTRLDSVKMIQADTALLDAEVRLERAGEDGKQQLVQMMRTNVVALRQQGKWRLHSVRAHPQTTVR